MVTDQISDLIIRLKNGSKARKAVVVMPYSKFTENVAHTLKKAGFISSVEKEGKLFDRTLKLGMIYTAADGARIHDVERISKPSRRVYCRSTDLRIYRSGFGNTVLSTPKGVLVDGDAKKENVGGEVLFKIW